MGGPSVPKAPTNDALGVIRVCWQEAHKVVPQPPCPSAQRIQSNMAELTVNRDVLSTKTK